METITIDATLDDFNELFMALGSQWYSINILHKNGSFDILCFHSDKNTWSGDITDLFSLGWLEGSEIVVKYCIELSYCFENDMQRGAHYFSITSASNYIKEKTIRILPKEPIEFIRLEEFNKKGIFI
ncbi:MAG: hypothetical protein KAS32_16240 [Candidatus Peribacteraceae bacterium]|nr:hypothetical protein [Candidatus Peribacteraceae bacterium]